MRALVIHCHPRPGSFTAAVRDVVMERLAAGGVEARLIDLYAEGFEPVLTAEAHEGYLDVATNRAGLEAHVEALAWCDTLVFVYPTWWYGLPAMLKGWLDRVFLPDVAFRMRTAPGETIAPALTNITRIMVFTTCGATRWLTFLVGAPGMRTLTRGVRLVCAKGCRTEVLAHYLMDSATPESLSRHLDRVATRVDRMTARAPRRPEVPA